MLLSDEEAYKRLQNLNKGLMGHAPWINGRRDQPGFDELNELVIKTIRSVNRVMRDMNNKGKQ